MTNKVAEDFDGEERFLSINQLISVFRYASSSSQSGSIFGPEFKALESSAHVSMLVFFRRCWIWRHVKVEEEGESSWKFCLSRSLFSCLSRTLSLVLCPSRFLAPSSLCPSFSNHNFWVDKRTGCTRNLSLSVPPRKL